MGRKSSIKALPESILAQVNFMLSEGGWSIDDVVAYLRDAGHPRSRSAIGRHKQDLDRVAARLRQSREMTAALARELGNASTQGAQGRLLVEMARTFVFDLLVKLQDGGDELDPKDVAFLGKGLAEMGKALRYDQDFELKLRQEAAQQTARQAAELVATEAKASGLSEEAAGRLRASILGIAS